MYSWSPSLSQILIEKLKVSFFFQILVKPLFSWSENLVFGRHFETVQKFRLALNTQTVALVIQLTLIVHV